MESSDEVLYLRQDLDIDLWFKGKVDSVQSVLIRSTTPDGQVRSAFMHIDGSVQQIPLFNNEDPLVLDVEKKAKAREFTWSPEKSQKQISKKFIAKAAIGIAGVIFLLSSLTGLVQMRVILTGSMQPAINPGDLVIAASTKFVEPQVGKVVLYSARDLDGKPVTVWAHRIISGNSKAGFTIKGDANNQADIGLVPVKDIQSVVLTRVPNAGYLFNIYSILLISAGVLLISWTLGKRRELK
jgi:signal peptidase I